MTQFDWDKIVDEAKAVRKEEGLTQRDLASLAGVSLPTILKFEKKDRSIRLEKAEEILLALGLAKNPADRIIEFETAHWSGSRE